NIRAHSRSRARGNAGTWRLRIGDLRTVVARLAAPTECKTGKSGTVSNWLMIVYNPGRENGLDHRPHARGAGGLCRDARSSDRVDDFSDPLQFRIAHLDGVVVDRAPGESCGDGVSAAGRRSNLQLRSDVGRVA